MQTINNVNNIMILQYDERMSMDIIRIFEDFLEKHNVRIVTGEMEQRLRDDESVSIDNLSNIYGTECIDMIQDIEEVIMSYEMKLVNSREGRKNDGEQENS